MNFNFINKIQMKLLESCYFANKKVASKIKITSELNQIIMSATDSEELKNKIIIKIATVFNASRCLIIENDWRVNRFIKIANSYNTKRDEESLLSYDFQNNLPYLAMKQKYMKTIVVQNTEKFIVENNIEGSNEDKYFKDYDIKAFMTIRLEFGEFFLGSLVVQFDENRKISKYDISILKDLAEHFSIALYLSTLYSDEKAHRNKEKLLRSIISLMSSDYNLDEVIKKIFDIISTIYDTKDIYIFISTENLKKNYFKNDFEIKDDGSEINNSLSVEDIDIYEMPCLKSIKTKQNYIEDTHNFIIQNNLENTLAEKFFVEKNIKSLMRFPIYVENSLLGLFIIHFNKSNLVKNGDIDFMQTIVNQLGIAVKQAQLFEEIKAKVETEKFGRKILEILRNTLDEGTIKNLFVKNIGQYYKADRVFFADYDPKSKTYFLNDKKYEYLSSEKEKSFVDQDWLNTDIINHVKPLLEKKELKIPNWEEYIKQNPDKAKEMELIYKGSNIKSSYSLPVVYESQILGYFCIEFTNKFYEFSNENINQLRNMCMKAAIALYNAGLYEKAQQCFISKSGLGQNFLAEVKNRSNEILDLSKQLSEDEVDRMHQIEYLKVIIAACHKLLDLSQ